MLKLNIQKRVVPFLSALCLVLLCFFPVSAAIASVPVSDGQLELSYNGDDKTAMYYFPVGDFSPYWSVSVNSGTRVSKSGATYQMSTSASASTYSMIGYPAGNYYIDVSDLIKPSMYRILYTPSINWIISGPPTSDVTWTATYQLWLYYYDSNGTSLGQGYAAKSITFDTSASGTTQLQTGVYLDLPDGCVYVRPTIQINSSTPAYCTVNVSMVGFTLSFDSNMVAENSETMNQINDKMDEIISGGSGGSGLIDKSDELDDKNDELNNSLDDLEDVESSLPTVPDDVNDLVDDEDLSSGLTELTAVMDWEAMGLSTMFPIMAVGLGLCVLMFVIFGKSK